MDRPGLLFYVLYLHGLLSRSLAGGFALVAAVTVALQWAARNGDEVQLGTNVAFLPAFIALAVPIYHLVRNRSRWDRFAALQLVGLGLFVAAGMNDMLVVMGAFDGYLFYSVGLLSQMIFLAFAVHDSISSGQVRPESGAPEIPLHRREKTVR